MAPRKYAPMNVREFADQVAIYNAQELSSVSGGLVYEANAARDARNDLIRQFPSLSAEVNNLANSPRYQRLGLAAPYVLATSQYHAATMNEASKNAPKGVPLSYINYTDTDKVKALFVGDATVPAPVRYDGYKSAADGIAQDAAEHAAVHGDSPFARAQFGILTKEQGQAAATGDFKNLVFNETQEISVTPGHRNRSMVYGLGVQEGVVKDIGRELLPGILTSASSMNGTLGRSTRAATVNDVMTQFKRGTIDKNVVDSFAKVYREQIALAERTGDYTEVDRIKSMPVTKRIIALSGNDFTAVGAALPNKSNALGEANIMMPEDRLAAARAVAESGIAESAKRSGYDMTGSPASTFMNAILGVRGGDLARSYSVSQLTLDAPQIEEMIKSGGTDAAAGLYHNLMKQASRYADVINKRTGSKSRSRVQQNIAMRGAMDITLAAAEKVAKVVGMDEDFVQQKDKVLKAVPADYLNEGIDLSNPKKPVWVSKRTAVAGPGANAATDPFAIK